MVAKSTKFIVMVGILSGLAFVLYFLEFPLAFLFPSFLKIDFSDLPAIFGGLAGGPIAGIAVELIKNILHFLLISKEPMASGEIANFCAGLGFMIPLLLLIGKSRERAFSPIPYVMGTIAATVTINVINYFVTLPLYGMAEHAQKIAFIYTAGLPFNIVKWILVSIATVVIYARVRGPIQKLALRG